MSVNVYIPGLEDEKAYFNLSNTNFCRLMDLIKVNVWTEHGLCGEFKGEELDQLIFEVQATLGMLAMMPSMDGGIADVTKKAENGPTITFCGVPPGYFKERLQWLLETALLAKATGLPLLYN